MIPRSVEELSRQLDEQKPEPSKPKTLEELGVKPGWGEVWNAPVGQYQRLHEEAHGPK
jgi:hypothetical protein